MPSARRSFDGKATTGLLNRRVFATQNRVVHVTGSQAEGERLVGVQFTGPRFQRFFPSESAA